jgi:hypothetical protein
VTFALAPALGLALVVAVGPALVEAQTSDGPGASPSLSLEPASGPPGTPVTATVTGFQACVEDADTGGDTSGVIDDVDEGVAEPGDVLLTWEGELVALADLVDGGARLSFPVPASAASEQQDVVASCDLAAVINATASFAVQPPGEVEPSGEVEPPGQVEPPGPVEPGGEVEPPGEVAPPDEVTPEVPDVVPAVASVDPWPTVLVVLVVLLIAVWLGRRLLRSRRDRRWVRRHVRVERGPTVSSRPVVDADDADGGHPTHVVRLEPHLDADPPTLEEVAP